MRKILAVGPILLLVLFLVSCTPKVAPASAPQAPASALAWQAKWEEVVQRAKEEGSLVLYTFMGPSERRIVQPAFENQYGVSIEWTTAGSAELGEKLASQRRAGLYQVDVWTSGAAGFVRVKGKNDPLEPAFILPELTEPGLIKKTWYFGELSWQDKEHTSNVSLLDLNDPIAINTNLVKPGEITRYADLLDPKWKGKISLRHPLIPGAIMWFSSALESGDVDAKYIRELIKQEASVASDRRLQVEWLAHGKHAIAIHPDSGLMVEFMSAGAPIKQLMIGTPFVSGGPSPMSLINRAPHPNAAKLFINWLLSKDGQLAIGKARGLQSQRLDVPTDYLDPSRVIPPGRKLFVIWSEEFAQKQDTTYKQLAKEIFGELVGGK